MLQRVLAENKSTNSEERCPKCYAEGQAHNRVGACMCPDSPNAPEVCPESCEDGWLFVWDSGEAIASDPCPHCQPGKEAVEQEVESWEGQVTGDTTRWNAGEGVTYSESAEETRAKPWCPRCATYKHDKDDCHLPKVPDTIEARAEHIVMMASYGDGVRESALIDFAESEITRDRSRLREEVNEMRVTEPDPNEVDCDKESWAEASYLGGVNETVDEVLDLLDEDKP